MRREIEIKLRIPNVGILRRRLKSLHAREVVPRTHESNTLYDTPSKTLTRRGRLIRIRIEQAAPFAKPRHPNPDAIAILTYKGPGQKSPTTKKSSRPPRQPFKIRHEVETTLSDGPQMVTILRALGLRPVFRYEKFRTTYVLPGTPNVKIEFDETPVGVYLELEGAAVSIDRAARLLGYTPPDYLTQTYGALHLADCRRRGKKAGDMLFPSTNQK